LMWTEGVSTRYFQADIEARSPGMNVRGEVQSLRARGWPGKSLNQML
jgi:hypothetical protein